MTRNLKTASVVILTIVALLVGGCALRAFARWIKVREMTPKDMAARLALKPEPKIEFKSQPQGNQRSERINVGYAEFEFPSNLLPNTSVVSRLDGESVVLKSDSFFLALTSPKDATDANDLGLTDFVREILDATATERASNGFKGVEGDSASTKGNIVDLQLFLDGFEPQPFSAVFMMDHAEFKQYLRILAARVLLSQKAERIIPFEGPHCVGLIYISRGGNLYSIVVTTHNRMITQDIILRSDNGYLAPFPSPILSDFLSTYRFTVESCPPLEEIVQMVTVSGILPEKDAAESEGAQK